MNWGAAMDATTLMITITTHSSISVKPNAAPHGARRSLGRTGFMVFGPV
jgi:hypothetical protein